MKNLLFGALAAALLCTPALAQQQARGGNNANFGAQNGNQNGNQGAVFALPEGVQNVVSIDALNMIIIASDGELPGQTRYTPSIIQHVYSGGIARLFGGSTVPTEQFATPGTMNNGGGNGFGNQNNAVAAGGGNQNGGFGGGGFGGGNQNGFGGGGGFQNGGFNGNGFNTQGRNVILNARVRAR